MRVIFKILRKYKMNPLDQKIQELKDQTIDTMHLVRSQLQKAKEAFIGMDITIAQEVIHYEHRVNASELSLDKNCENILALHHPVAIDLRFLIASIKVIGHLERIGDHAYGVAKYVPLLKVPYEPELLAAVRFEEMFDTAISMIDDAIHAFNFEDTKLARWVFGKDAILNQINLEAVQIIADYCRKKEQNIERYLFLFSTMRKIERVGDLCKNVAEETIFYLEAKVLKHKNKEY